MSLTPESNGLEQITQQAEAGPDSTPGGPSLRQRLGRSAALMAGLTLSVFTIQAFKAPESAFSASPTAAPAAKEAGTISEAIASPIAVTPRFTPFEMGVRVYNSQSENSANFFPSLQALGLNGDLENLIRANSDADLAQIKADDALAEPLGIQPAVSLADVSAASRAGFPQWAAETASKLPAGIDRVVIENEVDSRDFYDPPVKPGASLAEVYVDQLYKTYQAIKAVRPEMQVCGFALDSVAKNEPVEFFREAADYALDKYGGLQNIEDCLSVHSYVDIQTGEAMIEDYQSITGQPIWVDEFGRDLGQQVGDPQEQASQYEEFILWLYENLQVQGVNVYHNINPPVSSPVDRWQTGLRTPKGVLLPAGRTIEALTGLLLDQPVGATTAQSG